MNQKLTTHIPLARPPWSGLGQKIESMCRKALYEFAMLKNVKKLAVALSGGKDSLSLLFMLHAISGRGFPPIELHAIHVGGEYSCGAGVGKSYLREICDQLEVNFIVCPSKQEKPTECYSCSRKRRSLIFEAAKQVGAETVAFGHHREDSIYTLLMNLCHKGEFAAMLPRLDMFDYGVTIIRPLIYVPEELLREFSQMYGFARIVCQCPIGQHSLRKETQNLVAHVEKLFPNVRTNLSHASFAYGSTKAQKRD
ncbi:MAG TPA: tRNA 2-thiocytidine biosynthesis TtcA family protein [Rhabdochlamydiaceae bacterium]|jgi:tRNA(Ile)-lysidine synthase TilS/MesJ